MAARKRDYKAEYARRKALAQSKGYTSVRQYRSARKSANIPRTATLPPRLSDIARKRLESRAWSDKHSHRRNSRYRDSFTDAQVERYWRAYVEEIDLGNPRLTDFEKRVRIYAFLVPDFLKDEEEWKANPSTVPLRR